MQGYYGVGLYGSQDTLLNEIGNQVFAKCYIEGAVNFIFGQHARTWIDNSDLRVTQGKGAITANGRADTTEPSYFVTNKCSVSAAQFVTIAAGSIYPSSPWSQYERVCFQRTTLSNIVSSAGWEVWSSSSPNTAAVAFQEFENTGDGAAGTRASFSSTRSNAITISSILGSSYTTCVDTSYLAKNRGQVPGFQTGSQRVENYLTGF